MVYCHRRMSEGGISSVKEDVSVHTKNLCPKCDIPLEGTTCPVCGQRLGGKEFIPLESSGFSRRNLRLLGLLGGVVVLLGVCAMVLFAVGEQQQTTQVSSSFEESSESSVSEPELPSSLLDE